MAVQFTLLIQIIHRALDNVMKCFRFIYPIIVAFQLYQIIISPYVNNIIIIIFYPCHFITQDLPNSVKFYTLGMVRLISNLAFIFCLTDHNKETLVLGKYLLYKNGYRQTYRQISVKICKVVPIDPWLLTVKT